MTTHRSNPASAFVPDIEKASCALRAVHGLLAENAFQDEGAGRLDDVTEHGLACCVGLVADYLDGVIVEMRETPFDADHSDDQEGARS